MPASNRVLVKNTAPAYTHRVLLGTPTLGTVRMAWHNAVSGLVIPTNWANSTLCPEGYRVDDAQNIIVQEAVTKGFDWVILLEDDTVPPADLFLRLTEHMREPASPLISGLYHLKPGLYSSNTPEPLMYRGRGSGAFREWKPGAQVWVDGVPTGCLLLQGKLLRLLYDRAPTYTLHANGGVAPVRRVFHTPRMVFTDVELPSYHKLVGTSDLYLCDQLLADRGLLKAAGFPQLVKRKYPFLVDTGIRCGHIDRHTGAIV